MKFPLIIFSGESNSGGLALNSDALLSELSPIPGVQILNNSSLTYESLDVGTNNIINHLGATAEMNAQTVHGWELGLGNESSQYGSQVYLLKTGHGGSVISQWSVGNGSTYWTKFLQRVNRAKALNPSGTFGLSGYKPILWYTQGINDSLAGTPIPSWKTQTTAHFAKIRAEIPDIPILFTDVTPLYTAYSTAIQELVTEIPNCYFISATGAPLRDNSHWNYIGMKLISSRLTAKTLEIFRSIYTVGGNRASTLGLRALLTFPQKNKYYLKGGRFY